MLDKDFCEFLEYEITSALAILNLENLKHFWCDGVLLPTFETEFSKKFVNDNRRIAMTAFAGLDGQDKYKLVLKFGKKSLSKYARDLDIKECLPDIQKTNWLIFD